MPTTRLRPLERQNERRLRTSYIFSADFFFLRINRSRKSDVFEIFSKRKTAARADLVGRYSVDQDLNLILGPRWRPGPKFNTDHSYAQIVDLLLCRELDGRLHGRQHGRQHSVAGCTASMSGAVGFSCLGVAAIGPMCRISTWTYWPMYYLY